MLTPDTVLPVRHGTRPVESIPQETPTQPVQATEVMLSDLTSEYAFFNNSLLHLVGGLHTDVLDEWRLRTGFSDAALHMFDKPLWRGLGGAWDHVLGIVAVTAAKSLFDHIRTITIKDSTYRSLAQAVPEVIWIVDPVALRRAVVPDPLPLVPVTVFNLDATYGHFSFVDTDDPTIKAAVRGPASVRIRRLAEAVFAGASDPFLTSEDSDHGSDFSVPARGRDR